MELTAKQVAAILLVTTQQVRDWHKEEVLVGYYPFGHPRYGLRFRVSDVRRHVQTANDGGLREARLNEWVAAHAERYTIDHMLRGDLVPVSA